MQNETPVFFSFEMVLQRLQDWPKQTWAEWLTVTDFLSLSQTCKQLSNVSSKTNENELLWMTFGARRHPHFAQISACVGEKIFSFVSVICPDQDIESLAGLRVLPQHENSFNYQLYRTMHSAEWCSFFALGKQQFEALLRNTLLMEYVCYCVLEGRAPTKGVEENSMDMEEYSGEQERSSKRQKKNNNLSTAKHYVRQFAQTSFSPLVLPSLVGEVCVQTQEFKSEASLALEECIVGVLKSIRNLGASSSEELSFAAEFLRRRAMNSLEFCKALTREDFSMISLERIQMELNRNLGSNYITLISSEVSFEEKKEFSFELVNAQTRQKLKIQQLSPERLFRGISTCHGDFSTMFSGHRTHQLVISCIMDLHSSLYRFRQAWELAVEFMNHESLEPSPEIQRPLRSTNMYMCTTQWNAEFMGRIKSKKQIFALITFAHAHELTFLTHLCAAQTAAFIKGKSPEEIKTALTDTVANTDV
jgi:hypothetical protein